MTILEEQFEVVAEQLKQWRQSKTHHTEAVPAPLRQKVLALAKQFGTGKIKSALNISTSVLFRWQYQCRSSNIDIKATAATQAQEKAPEFIVLPNDNSPKTNSLVLELNVSEQCQLRLSGDISTAQLDVLTRNIFMYQSGALS